MSVCVCLRFGFWHYGVCFGAVIPWWLIFLISVCAVVETAMMMMMLLMMVCDVGGHRLACVRLCLRKSYQPRHKRQRFGNTNGMTSTP